MENNNRILIVDDNQSLHNDYRAVLCPEDSQAVNDLNSIEDDLFGEPANGDGETASEEQLYEVDSAFQGTEAIKMVRQAADEGRPYALIFMDVRMPPGIDGIETISRIWKEFPYIEMVICTAYSDYSWDEIITKLGSSDKLLFLKKPFASIAVKQMAQSLVAKWNLGEQSRRYTEKLESDVTERTKKIQDMLDELNVKNEKLLETQVELRDTESKFKVLTASSTDSIVLMDSTGKVSFWNPAAERLFGFDAGEILGQDLHSFIAPERYHKDFRKGLPNFQNTGQGYFVGKTLETTARKKDGTEFPVEVSFSALQVKGDWYAAGIIRDITERKAMEKQMKHMAHYDMLTGLPNRTLFFDRFTQFLSLARRHRYPMGVLYLDLDKFKWVNDNIGHDAGDIVLKEVAARLGSSLRESDTAARIQIQRGSSINLRESDTVARIGGDEFIILLSQITDKNDSVVVAERIVKELYRKMSINDDEITIGVSIGISVFPDDGHDMDTLIRNADMAMYQAKERGGNCYQKFIASEDRNSDTVIDEPQDNNVIKEAKE
jgi:PAS domain S-box-containing protein